MNPKQNLTIRIGAMTLMPILIAVMVAVSGVLEEPTMVRPNEAVTTVGLSLVTGLIAYFLAPRFVRPLQSGLDPQAAWSRSWAAIVSAGMMAVVIAEAGFLIGFAMAFVFQYTGGAIVAAAPVSALMIFMSAYPTQSRLRRYQDRLESLGTPSGMKE